LFFSGIIVSHVSSFFAFFWGWLALFVSFMLFKPFERKKIVLVFFLITLIGFLVAFPFVLSASINKNRISENLGKDYLAFKISEEAHPKSLPELFLFNGVIAFAIAFVGILFLVCALFSKTKNLTKALCFGLLLWWCFLWLQNSQWFAEFAVFGLKMQVYPLYVIMWFGLVLPLSFASGFAFEKIYGFFDNELWKKLCFGLALFLVLFCIVDYETSNFQKVYRPEQLGFFLHGIADRGSTVSESDLDAMLWLRQQNFDGIVLTPNNVAGKMVIVISEKKTTSFIFDEFSNDPDRRNEAELLNLQSQKTFSFFDENALEFIRENNVKYVFVPSSMTSFSGFRDLNLYYNVNLLTNKQLKVVYRKNGSKILGVGIGKNDLVYHLEAEQFSLNNEIENYIYFDRIDVSTVKLKPNQKLGIELNSDKIKSDKTRICIKHSAFVVPLEFEVRIGDFKKTISKKANKLSFSESCFVVNTNKINNRIEIIGKSTPINLMNYEILPEIDWIELMEAN